MTETIYFQSNMAHVKRDIGPAGAEPWASAFVPARIEDLTGVTRIDRRIDLTNWPKISIATMLFVRQYFAEVYRLWKTEAFVLFHRGAEDADYTVISPPWYTATAGHVSYDPNVQSYCTTCLVASIELEPGNPCPLCPDGQLVACCIAGTAHSHGAGDAGHSSIDDANELNQTGFHITFGRVNQGSFMVAPSFVTAIPGYRDVTAKGERHTVTLAELVDVPFVPGGLETIQFWLNRVAHPGLAKSMLDSGIDPEEIGVALDVDELSKIKEAKILRFIGSMADVERWQTRMGASTRLVTSWPVAHAALNPPRSPMSAYGAGYGSSFGGYPQAPLYGTAGGFATAKKTGKKGKKTTGPKLGVPVGTTCASRLVRAQTGLYGLVIVSKPPSMRLVRLTTHESGGASIQYIQQILHRCLMFADHDLARAAAWYWLTVLTEELTQVEWFDRPESDGLDDPTQDDVPTPFETFRFDVLDRVALPLMTIIEDINVEMDQAARASLLKGRRYAAKDIADLFGTDSIDVVLDKIITGNLGYVERHGLSGADAPFLEWFRLLGVGIQAVTALPGPAESGFDKIHDAFMELVVDLSDVLEDPEPASTDAIVSEAKQLANNPNKNLCLS